MTPEEIAAVVARKDRRAVGAHALDTLFRAARTARAFVDAPIAPGVLEQIVELAELGPTESNLLPLRVLFVQSPAGKERLRPLLSRGNVEKTLAAPVTAIVAADLHFHARFPQSLTDPKPVARFSGGENSADATRSALMNAAMQGAYLMLAVRALGLDVGPMAGFDRAGTDAAFFPGETLRTLWLANIGYADDSKLPPRAPRYTFAEIARIV